MPTSALKLVKGNPYDCRNSTRNFIKDYELEPIILDGEFEQEVLKEASCWQMNCEIVNIYNHEDMGRWETDKGVTKTLLTDLNGEYIIWNNQFVGYKYDGSLYFFPQSDCVGGNTTCVTISEDSRSEEYDKYTYTLKKIKKSNQNVFYAPYEDNLQGLVYGIAPNVDDVIIPEGVTAIVDDAFQYSGVKSISLPKTFKEITGLGVLFIKGCGNIETITVDKDNPVFHSSGNCLIDTKNKLMVAGGLNCEIPGGSVVKKIGKFVFYRSRIESIVIPEGVYTVDEYAFAQSNLESVVLPKSLVKINKGAFGYCNNLHIYYAGNKEEYEANLKSALCNFPRVYIYSNEQPTEDGKFWHYNETGEITIWKN